MKFVRLVATLLYRTSFLGSRSRFSSNIYCTKTLPKRRDTTPLQGSTTELFRQISPLGHPNVSITPILDQWTEEGRFVDKQSLIDIMNKLLSHNRFSQALEVSMWMTDKRYFPLTYSDAGCRLHLISKVKGMDETERYFNNLAQKLKGLPVYGALLNCYATAQCVEKAEAVMQQIRCLGAANHTRSHVIMLNLYRKTGNMEKFNALLQEMEEKGIDKTEEALNIQLSAYADVKDIEGMDKIVRLLLECDRKVAPKWKTYSRAAAAYTKAGLFDKALEMLKKAEALTTWYEFGAYNFLITQYGMIGQKDEVLRVWSLYKQKHKVVYNNGYRCVLSMLMKLGDTEKAEEIFKEWESQCPTYDIKVPSVLISAYSRRGLVGKAEALLDKAIAKGGKPYAWTWYYMYEGYVLTEQYEKAVEMMKKLIADPGPRGWKPVPTTAGVKACLEYLKGGGDAEKTEEFVKLLVDSNVISLDLLDELSVD